MCGKYLVVYICHIMLISVSKNLMVFGLFKNEILANPLMNVHGDNKESLCTETAGFFWKFAWKYFADKYGVLIRDLHEKSWDFSSEIMECSMQRIKLPIVYHRADWNDSMERSNMTAIFRNRSKEGVIFIAESAETFKINMHKLLKIDHDSKAIIFLTNSTVVDGIGILKHAWNRRKALNIILFTTDDLKNVTRLYVSTYDPFVIKNKVRGFVYTFGMKTNKDCIEVLLKILQTRLVDVHGYQLNICIYIVPGSVGFATYKNGSVTKHRLSDGEIIDALVKTMNFKPLYYNPSDGQTFGHKLPNGSFTGALLELESGRADILANTHAIRDYGCTSSDFLVFIDIIKSGFMTPSMKARDTVSFLEIFGKRVCIAIAIAYIAMVTMWWYLHKLRYKYGKNVDRNMDFVKICCLTYGNFILISQPGRIHDYERCLFVGWIFYSMVICFSYQATMLEHLASSFQSDDIDSFNDLAESGLEILLPQVNDIVHDLAIGPESPEVHKRLVEKSVYYDKPMEALKRVSIDRDAVMLSSLLECKMSQMKMIPNNTGINLIHIFEGGLPDRYTAHLVPMSSPYKARFNQILRRFREGGLMPKWVNEVFYNINKKYQIKLRYNIKQGFYTMKELRFVFYLLCGSCCLCCIVFFLELTCPYIRKLLRRK